MQGLGLGFDSPRLHQIGSEEMKVYWRFEYGQVGCELEGTIDVPDNATDEEIDKAVLEDILDWADLSWRRGGAE